MTSQYPDIPRESGAVGAMCPHWNVDSNASRGSVTSLYRPTSFTGSPLLPLERGKNLMIHLNSKSNLTQWQKEIKYTHPKSTDCPIEIDED